MRRPIADRWQRPLRNLRLSVTDRCNLRCAYCMPEPDYAWLPRGDLLTFEEISRVVDCFTGLGVDKLRLTGGEPLVRRDLCDLVAQLSRKPAIRDLALTTNGVLLADQASGLRAAGLHRVTVSLDTLSPQRFRQLTRRDDHSRVLAGIEAVLAAGFAGTKIDTVVLRGTNDDELAALLGFGRERGIEVRFIEYMDVGGATAWNRELVVARDEILHRLAARHGPIEALGERSSAPAERFRLADGTTFGVIASTTAPFCAACDRARLTADGHWFLCLYARTGLDLRAPLRAGASQQQILALIEQTWRQRADRGAEERLELRERRAPLAAVPELRPDPHLEMHTRGG
jgi:cyclic pyranopterin phosphate synthase